MYVCIWYKHIYTISLFPNSKEEFLERLKVLSIHMFIFPIKYYDYKL